MENDGAPFGEDSRYDVGRLINVRSARNERKLASRETEPVVTRLTKPQKLGICFLIYVVMAFL